ncbi:hypothetical protein CCR94_13315 [Rhodoblastus sphagnicola]|uniref:Uncharacterized protein n=1 Tax=Rhodoblastus sphagnicola TaxID=333368 RepID=A0A2S6N6Q3_9HYPH|nr:hypothetical protein [Rhodoblastus sphagnicola]MBB4197595.1 hypothetical protein [Rhodoblastus sphagnicola]PPQ30292.1 hypothetical protein CCR94_13315 [Rhodoblastus sphagnicola]
MRILFAASLACALGAFFGAPAGFALPVAHGLSAPAPLVQAKGKAKPKAARAKGGKCAAGAICPLVGGGDY